MAAFGVAVFIAIALLLFDASAFPVLLLALIIGCILAIVFTLLVDFMRHLGRHHPRFTLISVAITLIAVIAFAYSRTFRSEGPVLPTSTVGAIGPGDGNVMSYRALVTPNQPSPTASRSRKTLPWEPWR
jgi:uncharacterized membrane protein